MAALARLLGLLALAASGRGEETTTCPGAVLKQNCTGPRTPLDLLATLAHPSVYDKTARPPCGNSTRKGPTIVEVQVRLTQLNSVDPKVGTIVANGYFRTWWKDPRLAYNGTKQSGCVDAISIAGRDMQGIWMPDIYVDNLVEQKIAGMESLTQIYPDGSVWRSEQVLLTVKSQFNLRKLPYDEHIAQIVAASYSQDITQMRVMPKGGKVGPGVSGVGISAAPMTNAIWTFENGKGKEGFETPAEVVVSGDWDYVYLNWSYQRNPKYFITQVMVPCGLFLLISYMQFWVSAAAAPARAALAVIPVLIMRTMSNSIYDAIPQGSQFMWLDTFVQIAMFLCILAALHFGVVQAWRVKEAKRAAKLVGLSNSKAVVDKLVGIAQREEVPLLNLLRKFRPVEKVFTPESLKALEAASAKEANEMDQAGEDEDHNRPSQPVVILAETKMTVQSDDAKKDGATEADLLFIVFARDVFQRYDIDESNSLSVSQVRQSLTYFDVYKSHNQTKKVVAMYLRDSGFPSLIDESKNCLNFSQFVNLLMVIGKYSLKLENKAGLKEFFQGIRPSERWDIGARAVFPVLMVLQYVVMYALLKTL